jgi:hypothetical protein
MFLLLKSQIQYLLDRVETLSRKNLTKIFENNENFRENENWYENLRGKQIFIKLFHDFLAENLAKTFASTIIFAYNFFRITKFRENVLISLFTKLKNLFSIQP